MPQSAKPTSKKVEDGAKDSRLRVRSAVAPGPPVGIDEEMIVRVVVAFYDRVRDDELLGPIFIEHIEDWDAHLAKMADFWSSVLLMSGRYHGKPMVKHAPLNLSAAHFAHWLALFEDTSRQECPEPAARLFVDRARRIAQSLQLGVGIIDPLTDRVLRP